MSFNVWAVVPAHNEEKGIEATIRSLMAQTLVPNVLVVADNCSDGTVEIVEGLMSEFPTLHLFVSVNNSAKKAGALNQGIGTLPEDTEFVFVMDADTVLDEHVIQEGVVYLRKRERVGAVCTRAGILDPTDGTKPLFWRLQRLEYAGFDSERIETQNNLKVIHGMAAMYRAAALRQLYAVRGMYYDQNNLVEDYELTVSLKELGWQTSVNLAMEAWTELPMKVGEWWVQRLRWLRGGVDTLRQHGWNSTTRGEILSHWLFIFLISFQIIMLAGLVITVVTGGEWRFNVLVVVILGAGYLDSLYRLKYAKEKDALDVLIRLAFIFEFVYLWMLIAAMIYSYWLSFRNKQQSW